MANARLIQRADRVEQGARRGARGASSRSTGDLRRTVSDREAELASVRARLAGDDEVEGELRYDAVGIVGRSPAMRKVFEVVDRVVESDFPVLIEGESGTSARSSSRVRSIASVRVAPSRSSPRTAPRSRRRSWRASCSGLGQGRVHRRHQPARAARARPRRHALPRRGVGDVPGAAVQAAAVPAGGRVPPGRQDRSRCASTSGWSPPATRTFAPWSRRGGFREDLFYRLNVLPVRLPPLRARRDDIPALVERFVARAAVASGRPIPAVAPDVIEAFARHGWPVEHPGTRERSPPTRYPVRRHAHRRPAVPARAAGAGRRRPPSSMEISTRASRRWRCARSGAR